MCSGHTVTHGYLTATISWKRHRTFGQAVALIHLINQGEVDFDIWHLRLWDRLPRMHVQEYAQKPFPRLRFCLVDVVHK